MSKTVLIVGIAGFVGAELAKSLTNFSPENATFIVGGVDIAPPDSAFRLKGPPFDHYPLSRYYWKGAKDLWPSDLQDWDYVVNLAAVADVPFAMESPKLTSDTNTEGILNLLECINHCETNVKLIHQSSESVYGKQSAIPITENAAPRPANIYGATKLASEAYVTSYHDSYGVDAAVIRSSTLFGPNSRLKQMIPIFLTQALSGQPVTVHGGDQTRDMNYVSNLVDAIMLVIRNFDKANGEILNIGSGEERRVRSIAEDCLAIARDLSPSSSKIEQLPYREGEEGLRLALDISKAKTLLGYEPKVKFDEGLMLTANWLAHR